MQLTSAGSCAIINHVAAVMQQTKYKNADMAESADALDSGSSGSNTVCVQVTLSAPSSQMAIICHLRAFFIFYNCRIC